MSWFSNLFKKQHGDMLIWCTTCSRDFFKSGKELGHKDFINCPLCGKPTPIVPYSPAQEAAKSLARMARDMDMQRPLFCCACGKDLTGMAAGVDQNTGAVYCDKHASSYRSSFRGNFRSCRGCGYRYHLEAGSQIRTCPNCSTALSPATDPE